MKKENRKKERLQGWMDSLESSKPGDAALILDTFITYAGIEGALSLEDFRDHCCPRMKGGCKDFKDNIGQMTNTFTSDKEGSSHSVRPFKIMKEYWREDNRYVLHDDVKKILREIQWDKKGEEIEEEIEEEIRQTISKEASALEGGKIEKNSLVDKRNYKLAQEAKKRDHYTCKGCGFNYDNKIVEAHHLKPLANYEKEEITERKDIITLCPTCHRLAHYLMQKKNDVFEKDILISELKKVRPSCY
ncbi:MAG: HNH endonuclease [Akkermansia sp.]